jgi:anti-sigma factor RsiW
MTFSEETLMAYADGEVDEATRSAVERAMHDDPEISRRIERHRALRGRLQAGFAAELTEPVPERLLAAMRAAPPVSNSNVVRLQDAQAARERAARSRAKGPAGSGANARVSAFWRAAPSLAAGVVLGLAIGYGLWRQAQVPIGRGAGGALVADGVLDGALSNQLTGAAGSAVAVRIGLSYRAKSGEYCRSFTLLATPASGIACRDAGQWHIQALTQDPAVRHDAYRPAATALPAPILKMIEEQIQGEPLDAAGESSARQHRWQSPK